MRRFSRSLAICVGLALLGAACGGGDGGGGEGAAPDEKPVIKIGAVFDLSGATSDVGEPYALGVKDYFESIRDTGIDGQKFELMSQDYEYNVEKANQLYAQYAPQVKAFIGWGTADTEALRPKVNAAQLPFISASYSESLANPEETPYNFFPGPSYSDQMRVVLKWISEQEKGAQTEVAVFHHPSPFGESPLQDGKDYIAENDLKIGFKTYPMVAGAADFVGELSKVRADGAKYIVIQNVPSPAAKLLQNIKSQGLAVQTICLNYCGDELLVRLSGDAAEGVMGAMPFAPPATATTGLEDINAWLSSQGKDLNHESVFPPLRYVQGWFTAKAFLAGLTEGAKEGEADGPAMKEGLESIKDFQIGVGPPITWSAEDHSGMDGVALYKVQSGAWTKLTDVLEP